MSLSYFYLENPMGLMNAFAQYLLSRGELQQINIYT